MRIAQKALHIEPSSIHLRRELALLSFQQGNTSATHGMIGMDSSMRPDEAKEMLPFAAMTDDSEDAQKCAQKAIMLNPSNVQNWKVLAYIRARDVNLSRTCEDNL